MKSLSLRSIAASDETTVARLLEKHWGSRNIVSRGTVRDAAKLPGFVAIEDSELVGLITLHVVGESCEVVSLDAFAAGRGIGTRLLEEGQGYATQHGCNRIWLITSNDNVEALSFYQKRGFRIVAVHPDAISEARKLKPEIPLVAVNGIEIRDEIELERRL